MWDWNEIGFVGCAIPEALFGIIQITAFVQIQVCLFHKIK
jgi:hypothetical protein